MITKVFIRIERGGGCLESQWTTGRAATSLLPKIYAALNEADATKPQPETPPETPEAWQYFVTAREKCPGCDGAGFLVELPFTLNCFACNGSGAIESDVPLAAALKALGYTRPETFEETAERIMLERLRLFEELAEELGDVDDIAEWLTRREGE